MFIDQFAAKLEIEISDLQRITSAFLKSRGYRLGFHYGLDNCVEAADELMAALGIQERAAEVNL